MTAGRCCRFVLACLCVCAILDTAFSQSAHTLQGKVLLSTGEAPSNSVRVTLTYNGARVYETFTDLSGRFSFTGLRPGVYQLEAEGDGRIFETTRVRAEVSAFGAAPQTFTQNIPLRSVQGKAVPRADTIAAETSDPALPQQARDEYKKGSKRASDDKPEEALKHFEQAIQAAPGFYAAHLAMADQYLKLRRFDQAAASYLKARELKPDRAEPISGLGATFIQQQKYGEALAQLHKVVEMGKQSSATYLYLGLGETMTGDYAAAEADLKRSFELSKAPVARIYLANLYELKGESHKAIEQLQAFLKENPDAPQNMQVRAAIEKLRKQSAKNK